MKNFVLLLLLGVYVTPCYAVGDSPKKHGKEEKSKEKSKEESKEGSRSSSQEREEKISHHLVKNFSLSLPCQYTTHMSYLDLLLIAAYETLIYGPMKENEKNCLFFTEMLNRFSETESYKQELATGDYDKFYKIAHTVRTYTIPSNVKGQDRENYKVDFNYGLSRALTHDRLAKENYPKPLDFSKKIFNKAKKLDE